MKLLFLGDSYTIGEGVEISKNFPNQLIACLKSMNISTTNQFILAKTGWTTFELLDAIDKTDISNDQSFVTLLIGVNNQYRGLDFSIYVSEFELLLKKAIHFATDKSSSVIVLSIPDWGKTPFAEGRDADQIQKEIDQYNEINKKISNKYGVNYLDITNDYRKHANDPTYLAADLLHPSEKEYEIWSTKLTEIIMKQVD